MSLQDAFYLTSSLRRCHCAFSTPPPEEAIRAQQPLTPGLGTFNMGLELTWSEVFFFFRRGINLCVLVIFLSSLAVPDSCLPGMSTEDRPQEAEPSLGS